MSLVYSDHVFNQDNGKSLHGMVVKMLDCDIIISEFELQLYYYVDF